MSYFCSSKECSVCRRGEGGQELQMKFKLKKLTNFFFLKKRDFIAREIGAAKQLLAIFYLLF